MDARHWVMLASLAISVVMLVGKLTAYFITHSAAVLADASESMVHGVATGFAVFSLWYSQRPADADHRYGHGRIIYFSAGFEGALVFAASLAVIGSGVYDLWHGPSVHRIGVGLVITVGLAAINLALGLALVRIGRRRNALVLVANGKHVLADVYTTVAAILGLTLVLITGNPLVDPIAAILIGFLIMSGGISLMRSAISGLMDKLPPELANRLQQALETCCPEHIREVHEVRARQVDNEIWLQMHVLVDGATSTTEAHAAVTRFEQALQEALPEFRMRINSHIEPTEHDKAHPEGH